MPLQAFSFPFPETRFFKAGSYIFKFKIRGGSSFSGEEVTEENCMYQELEDILRTVLGNLDSLQPFSSAHFNVFPYKKPWKGASKVTCKHGEESLKAYPFSVILNLEKNTQNEGAKQAAEKVSPKAVTRQLPSVSEPQSKRRRRDSPLEEAILKDLHAEMEAEGTVTVVGRRSLHCPHAHGEGREDRGHVDTKGSKKFAEPRQKSGVNTIRGSGAPGEVHSGSMQHMGEEERDEEEIDSVSGTPVRPGMLRRLARIFPFSLLFGDP
ncbi:membrane-anchored junction protein isoform X2 [Pseudoliparis swirei]|uniref:membrane-anchored junction protein isoform X2 n=1 Tax=Pseudoliparis swirei TaxID=2059687 RepID=UPI0024BE13E2|nr:membrane-anchored junction protein isoform X2 [Pseudoliparis swirei]